MIGLKEMAALIASAIVFLSSVFVPTGGTGLVAIEEIPGGGTEAVADGTAPIHVENLHVLDLVGTRHTLSPPSTLEGELGELSAIAATDQGTARISIGGQNVQVPPGSHVTIEGLAGSLTLGEGQLSTLLTVVGTAETVRVVPPHAPAISTTAESTQGIEARNVTVDGVPVGASYRNAGAFDLIQADVPVTADAPSILSGQSKVSLSDEQRFRVDDFVGVVIAYEVSDSHVRLRLDGYGNLTAGDESYNVSHSTDKQVNLPSGPGDPGDPTRNDPPEANFTYRPTMPSVGDVVHFVDRSEDDIAIDDWSWEFGDGSTSDKQNPDHVYERDGVFTVRLTVTDVLGESSSETKAIHVANSRPEVRIDWEPIAPVEEQTVDLHANVDDADDDVVTIEWSFSDGHTADGPHIERSFPVEDAYGITVVATDADGAKGWANETITVKNAPPVPSFEIDPPQPTAGEPATLRSTSTDPGEGSIVNTTWNVPDVGEVYGTEAEVVFPRDGQTPVELTVEDDDGARRSTEEKVKVRNPAPDVSIHISPVYPNPGDVVDFTAQVEDDDRPERADWSFSDGVERWGLSTSRRFNAGGTFDVHLEVEDADGANGSATRTFQVNHAPTAKIGVLGEGADLNETATMTSDEVVLQARVDDPDGNETEINWLVDGHNPDSPTEQACSPQQGSQFAELRCAWSDDGNHSIRLSASDDNGAVTRDSIDVLVINRPPTLDPQVLAPIVNVGEPVMIAANAVDPDGHVVNVTWEQDGDIVARGQTPLITFENAGQHTLTVLATDDDGARENVTFQVDVNAAPTLTASVEPRTVEAGEPVRFEASASDPDGPDSAIEITWSFGDGETSMDAFVDHVYTEGGNYTAVVNATDEHGASTTRSFEIEATTPPLGATLTVDDDTPRDGDGVRFHVEVADGRTIERIEWDLDDGETQVTGSGVTDLNHTYDEPRHYTVTAKIHADRGDQQTVALNLRVTGSVAYDFTFAPKLPDGQCVNLDDPDVEFRVTNLFTREIIALDAQDGKYVWERSGDCTIHQSYPPGTWSIGDEYEVRALIEGASTFQKTDFTLDAATQNLDFIFENAPIVFAELAVTNRTSETFTIEPDPDRTTYHNPTEPVYVAGLLVWSEGTPVKTLAVDLTATYRGPLDLVQNGLLQYRSWTVETGTDGHFETLVPAPVLENDDNPASGDDPEGTSFVYAPGHYRVGAQASSGAGSSTNGFVEFIEDPASMMNTLRENGIFV